VRYLFLHEHRTFGHQGAATAIIVAGLLELNRRHGHNNVSVKFTEAVYYQGSRIASLSLANSYATIAEVLNRQNQFNVSNGGQ
jgi:hypothetical protein